ncbi:class I SAM-dependent methyltransferase [Amycolatopsis circi]|uniref:class I SAM-dependent methyltransferase n=1 Tax=Amycolatopsis circi TaxID=871959 RepID=UPI000E26AF41|nr:class I SAM-dependent methyltransferase [Amycolatopsis circi]
MSAEAIEECYAEAPALYAAVARDRDFARQIAALENLVAVPPGGRRLLELFAGPGYHAIEALRRGWRAHAIDVSPGMRRTALEAGFSDPDHYVAGHLPEALDLVRDAAPFDCVLAARYSLGYLDRPAADRLLAGLMPVLRRGGFAVLELHDLRLVTGGLGELGIRERASRLPDGSEVRCRWPDGEVEWSDPDDYVAVMGVRIDITATDGTSRRLRYRSREHIYSATEITCLAARYGLSRVTPEQLPQPVRAAFPDAVPLVLVKDDHTPPSRQ